MSCPVKLIGTFWSSDGLFRSREVEYFQFFRVFSYSSLWFLIAAEEIDRHVPSSWRTAKASIKRIYSREVSRRDRRYGKLKRL